MDSKKGSSFVPLMGEGVSNTLSLAEYLKSQQRKRSVRDAIVVISCFLILAWCGYLTLSVKDGTFNMRLAEMEIKKIEEVVNDVVAAIPSEKNPEVIKASVHIEEHGVNYQQSISYDPWTKIARVHNPQHLDIDETITLMHKPSGMMLMLNNNHKHCEYSEMPEGLDPEDFAEASKEVEEEQKTLKMDLPQTVETLTGTILGGTLTIEEREDLHPELQKLCSGLDIFHIKKIKLPANSANNTEWVVSSDQNIYGANHGRMKRSISCNGGQGSMLDKCYRYSSGWGHSCMWIVCNRKAVKNGVCLDMYNHMGSQIYACVMCCEDQKSSSLCRCNYITGKTTFTECQYKMECHLGMSKYCV